MSDRSTAVALLFDDAELGGHLRTALSEHGARIVHEGPLASLDQTRLQAAGAEVVVVNLDDAAGDESLDRLYGMIEDGQLRVVFNDAQASRGLDGWDRARWARHLAVKALAIGDVDPPRPQDARALESAPVAPAAPSQPSPELAKAHAAAAHVEDVAVEAPVAAALPPVAPEDRHAVPESETLAAELEALLAADEPQHAESETFGSGLKYAADAELPPLHDGNFGHVSPESVAAVPTASIAPASAPAAMPAFQLDHLALTPLDEALAAHVDAAIALDAPIAVAKPSAPAWSLLEDEVAPPADEPVRHDASAFGIQKMSAADYLAPTTDVDHESPIEPGLSLELVSIEEAIAPQHYVPNEMVLDELGSALGRVVLLGATTESTTSVCEFLSALPRGLRATVLHTQHLAGKPAEALVEYLAQHCVLPVRLAGSGGRARTGEVLVVPSDQQVRLLRDGSVELQALEGHGTQSPSIDVSFTTAASVFGRDALAIVFAGSSTDAVGGCQAIHDRGGRVWVETSSGEHFADMVSGIMAEHLSHFSGTPRELASRLAEELSMEGRQ